MIDWGALITGLTIFWWFIPLFMIIIFLKNPWTKGKIGELFVNSINKIQLDKEIYTNIKDITVKLKNGNTVQIDHIVVSKYGIFVIETKNYKGWIYGSERGKTWTQVNFKQKHKFQNPLHQNYGHIKALQETIKELIPIDINKFVSVVVFMGESEFKTDMPINVIKGIKYTDYIKSFDTEILNNREIKSIINKIGRKRLEQGFKTDREHVENLRQRHN